MARDYVRRSKSQKTSRGSRAGGRARAPERRIPWLALILALALLGGLGYLILLIKGSAAPPPAPPASAPAAAQQAAPVNPINQKPVEKWRYIEQLENKEIIVDVPKPADERNKPAPEPAKSYVMQCGSFRSADQAEQLKARIAFQGLASEVRRSEGSNGIWYRVIMGPYPSQRAAEQDKHKMSRLNTDCVVRQG
ncbi:SPOR domain-containing protein [Zobellella taiwanensis]